MKLTDNFFRGLNNKQEIEPINVEQYLYHNLEFNVYELYVGKITETPNFKYIGKMSYIMAKLKNLEETNR